MFRPAPDVPELMRARQFALHSQVSQIKTPAAAVFGDSLVEGALLSGLFNAGVGAAKAIDVANLIRSLRARRDIDAHFSSVIVSVGVNNAIANHPPSQFEDEISEIVKAADGIKTVLTTIPVPANSNLADPDLVSGYNKMLLDAGARHRWMVADLSGMFAARLPTYAGGFRPDGVHLSPAGYAAWCPVIGEIAQTHAPTSALID